MAFDPYSERFAVGDVTSGTLSTLYTVPTGKRAIVRQLTFMDATGGGTGGTVALVGPGTSDFLLTGSPLGAASVHLDGLHLVFYAGENIRLYRLSGSVFYSVHGYLLGAP